VKLVRRIVLMPAVISCLVGCYASNETTGLRAPRFLPQSAQFESWPTEAEVQASGAGYPSASFPIGNQFVDANFRATGTLHFTWANDVTATLQATIVKQEDGSTFSQSGVESGHWYRIALPVASGDTTLVAVASKLNRNCGLTGTSHGHYSAKQIVTASNPTDPAITIASYDRDSDGAPVDLDACPTKDSTFIGNESGDACENGAETCGGSGGGGGEEGGGGQTGCVWHYYIVWESADGGNTWEEIYRSVWQEC
jgi:hypothetical protein